VCHTRSDGLIDQGPSTGGDVTARWVAVADGFVNSAMDVHAIANGLYLINITAGEKTFTERLVIQHLEGS
jgi:hypothetical protein